MLSGMLILTYLAPMQLYADWVLVDDFQDGLDKWANVYQRGNFGEFQLLTDPEDPTNQTFFVVSGGEGEDDFNTMFATIELPVGIPDGGTGTLYFRYYQEAPDNNFHMMLSAAPLAQNDQGDYTSPVTYGVMEAIWRKTDIGGGTGQETTIRDETQYPRVGTGDSPETFVPFIHDNQVWYEIWMVVRNEEGPLGDNYSVYVRGGEFEEPTLLYIEFMDYFSSELTGDYYEEAFFRNGTPLPIITLTIATESGWAGSPNNGDVWMVDDIYISHGENLTSPLDNGPPPPVRWAGFNVADGVADTGDWLGAVYVLTDSGEWIYVDGFGQFFFARPVGEEGAWLYSPETIERGEGYAVTGSWLGTVYWDEHEYAGGGLLYSFAVDRWFFVHGGEEDGTWFFSPR